MMKKVMLTAILGIMSIAAWADSVSAPTPAAGAVVKGVVVDSLANIPVEYANVVLYQDGRQVDGTVSRQDGSFSFTRIKPGVYSCSVKFMGYYERALKDVSVKAGNAAVDLGVVYLNPAVLMLQGVETTAEKPNIEYQIDKKVINVSKQYTAASGSAVDVLENVPSVTVDLDGNVSLRGSGNFRLLVDGRPTIVDAADALRQIPAASIETIEIITNPSAKFDPDGTAGIINVMLKKNTLQGLNGLINLNGGVNDKYGTDILLNHRSGGVNIFFGANYNRRFNPGSMIQRNRTFFADTTSFVDADGSGKRGFTGYSFRTGMDWNLSDRDLLNIGVRIGERGMKNSDVADYSAWRSPGIGINSYTSFSSGQRGGSQVSANLSYRRRFDSQGHALSLETQLESDVSDDQSTDELLSADKALQSGRRAAESGPERELRLKADYTLPLGGERKFEAGVQSRLSQASEDNELYQYDPTLDDYQFSPQFSYRMDFTHNIHALYSMYSAKWGKLGYQAGLRGEYTYRTLEWAEQNGRYTIDRWDYFPSAHLSYQLPAGQQVMAGYTRRIERPRDFFLEPFTVWMDAYNVRQGNPALLPEYINSYELSYQKNIGRNLISFETYYRTTENRIDRVQSVYAENVMLMTFDNIGRDRMLGGEVMVNADLLKLWNVNLMGNIYDYRIDGALRGVAFSRKSFNWNTRLNNTFKLSPSMRMQLNFMYNSPSVSAQGRREGFMVASAALRSSFLKDKLEVIVQVNDLFKTGRFEFFAEGADFYRYNRFTREAPMYTITLNYILNNYKMERRRNGDEADYSGYDEM